MIFLTFNSIFFFIIIRPIGEWVTHYILHKINNKRHKDHHIFVHNLISYDKSYFYNSKKEIHLLPICIVLYILGFNKLFIALFYYWIIHILIHINPVLFPELFKHHAIHHKNPNVNYGVTTIWVDILFGTYKSEY